MLFWPYGYNVNKGEMAETLFALAGDNKSWKTERTGTEMRQGVEARKK